MSDISSEIAIPEDAKELVKKIIAERSLKVKDVIYKPGTEAGDGYMSKTLQVEIVHEVDSLDLFFKCGLDIATPNMPSDKYYQNELLFYNEIYPEYIKFCADKGVEDCFSKVPDFYGAVNITFAFENLRQRKFRPVNKRKCLDDAHMKLVLKTFAKFHALSYAFKDQKREKYDNLISKTYDFFSLNIASCGLKAMTANTMKVFFSRLDPVQDKLILDHADELYDKLLDSMDSAIRNVNKYSILGQADTHCNNMMFLYEGEDTQIPNDIRLLDWQTIRPASPVYDLSYFFYASADKEAMDNLEHYLKFYHDRLRIAMKHLDSDADILYPYDVLKEEWKQFAKYGVGWGFIVIRLVIAGKDEAMNFADIGKENAHLTEEILIPKLSREDEFMWRMKAAMEHLIKNEFL